ncbi:MAG TPA: transglutaminase domain-containing protein [Gemmatimonadaceae bacterium]|nr:transglutaminase domain-containing protein [Gemmatimonadaceae bacterium]
MSGWPGKIWLTIAAVLAIAASGLLFRRWRSAPFIIGCLAVAAAFLWPAFRFGSDGGGLKIGGLSFGNATTALIVVALAISAVQLWKLASSPRLPSWVRFIPAVFAIYAIASIVLGIVRGTSASGVLSGQGWLPWWISGPYLGNAVLLPLGFVISLVALGFAIAKRRAAVVPATAILVLMLSAFVVSGLELTRNGRPNLAQFIMPAGAVAISSGSTSVSQPETSAATKSAGVTRSIVAQLGPGEESLAPYVGKDLDEIFARISTGVRYEPYSGIQRGAIGTAIARSGNSADQSMLLAEVLRRGGYKVRYARGILADSNVTAAIRGMYPPGISVDSVGEEYAPYNPATDTDLRKIVADHMWVEVFQGETWLPLDPSFPRAKIGEAYAQGSERFDAPADALFQRVDASLKEETVNGRSRELAHFAGTVSDLGMKPISLVVRAIPQSTGGDVPQQAKGSPAAAMKGMGDALGGATAPPPPPKATPKKMVGVAYVRDLSVGAVSQKVQRTTVRDGDAGAAIRREWIEFNLTGPGAQPRRIERVLYQADEKSKAPSVERRYTISVLSGRIPRSFADEQTYLAKSLVNVETFESRAKRLADTSPDDPSAKGKAIELASVGDALGTVAGHLMALRFAAESDSLSRRIADGTAMALAWATPRIFIVGIEMTGGAKGLMDAKVSLDLRLDELRAYPWPGAPSAIVPLFQTARGIQESVIEGRLVALSTGRDPTANTAQIISVAEKQGVPLVVINTSTRSRLGEIVPGIPPTCVQMMDAALAKGREIIIPSRAIALGGEQQWGWWEVDPASGQVVGVMQNGEHQGMVEYSVNSEEMGLNDDTGKIFGMMMGSITTVGTLSGLLLKYGDVTPQVVAELESYVSKILCNSCIESAAAKASVSGPGASISAGNECYQAKRKFGGGGFNVGAEIKVGFCAAYGDGFKCSSGLIMRALKKQAMTSSDVKFSMPAAGSEAAIGCTNIQR